MGPGGGFGVPIVPLCRLLQVKLEREELEDELRELRERLAAARQETERARGRAGDPGELDALRKVGEASAGGTVAAPTVPKTPTPRILGAAGGAGAAAGAGGAATEP